jgi:SAM-dependent methyltransferase
MQDKDPAFSEAEPQKDGKRRIKGICWCGNPHLESFSPTYSECPHCGTLVLTEMPDASGLQVNDDQKDFYGRRYYESHLQNRYHYPSLEERARADLPERCLHWLRALLKYKLSPARLLELGSAHGAFIALLRLAEFEAKGLELSPSLVEFAQKTFHVPILLGPLEEQSIERSSIDGILLMDVLEHLPDPVGTLSRCFALLKSDGIILVQTPHYIEGKCYEEMTAHGDRFLAQLKADEHLYLFSQRSIREFFRRLGAEYLIFEPAIFSYYDMFFVASQTPISKIPAGQIEDRLRASPQGRMVQAMIDLQNEGEKFKDLLQRCEGQLQECEADRAARLEAIHELTRLLHEPFTLKLWRKIRALGK